MQFKIFFEYVKYLCALRTKRDCDNITHRRLYRQTEIFPTSFKGGGFFYRKPAHFAQPGSYLKMLYLWIAMRFLIKFDGKISIGFETLWCEKNFVALLCFLLLFCNKRNKATGKSQKWPHFDPKNFGQKSKIFQKNFFTFFIPK